MSKNVVLIDADSICYLGNKDDTLTQILEKVDNKINAILEKTEADYYCLFISKGKYFRYDLKDKSETTSSYKENRSHDSQPYKRVVKAYLEAEWGAVSYSDVEADDIISWLANQKWDQGNMWINPDQSMEYKRGAVGLLPDKLNVIIASVDKDLLQSIEGKHLNYNKKVSPEEWDMVWVETTTQEKNLFRRGQMIIGDPADNVPGIKGKGKAYWKKMVDDNKYSIGHILYEYCKFHGTSQGIYEFQKNYRLLHLLETDQDWLREVGYVPELPVFRKVEKEIDKEIKIDSNNF